MKEIGTDLSNRAKKLYKNKGFEFAIREALTNAIHACILSSNLKSDISINIENTDDFYNIIIQDNGTGIDKNAYYHIINLDLENETKINNNLPSLGQGRLSFIHFCENIKYTSCYNENNKMYKRQFTYHDDKNALFSSDIDEECHESNKCYTKLELSTKDKTAKTFFKKHGTIESFKEFIILNFFSLLNRKKRFNNKS